MAPAPFVTVRPLRPADVPAADLVAWGALQGGVPADLRPDEAVRAPRGRARIAHLLATDPQGCWVAEAGGEIVGVALALMREGLWGFSLFGVRPDHHALGIGTRLFAPALAYGDGARGGIILSSEHPAAMRRYARAGFALHPCVTAAGMLDRSALPAGLRSRPADLSSEADRATIDRASRHVRGASHGADVEVMGSMGWELLVLPGAGWAAHRDGSPGLVAATTEAAARDLALSCLATAPGGTSVHLDFITAANQWAIEVALDLRLALSPEGPVFVRGDAGPMAPYLPSGAFL
jgi:ribosomal protein S18 acetylase RimI-like enzyme